MRLAGPVEHVLYVDFPVAADGLPGLPVDRPRQGRPGVEDQCAGAVLAGELACDHRVGGVGGDGGEGVAELRAQFLEPAVVTGDPGDGRAVLDRATAMARPKPRLAPVTSAVVPGSCCAGMPDSLVA